MNSRNKETAASQAAPVFWAVAPEYAAQVLESYRLAQTPPQSPASTVLLPKTLGRGPEPASHADAITEICGNVAVIRITGPLNRATRLSFFTDEIYSLGQDAIRAAVEAALANPEISAILLSFNSPGGVVAGTKELADFIAETAGKKRMAAYADGLCASAAFWLAAATGEIYAPGTAQVGSVGVIMAYANMAGFYQRMGVKLEYISSGKFKAAGRGERDLSDEEREYFQEQISALHAIFKNDVAAHLGLDATGQGWSEAQVMLGEQAAALGLVKAVIRDEQSLVQKLQEETMPPKITLDYLRAEEPGLVAEIESAALARAKPDESLALAIMKSVCSDAQYAACANLYKVASGLNLNATQASGLMDTLKAARPEQPAEAETARRLAQINAAYPDPLNAAPKAATKSALIADAEQRSRK